MDFDDFVLDVIATSDGETPSVEAGSGADPCSARVIASPDGSTDLVPIHLPSRETLRRAASLFSGGRDFERQAPVGEDPDEWLREVGFRLAEGVFRGEIRSRWAASVARCSDRGRALRLCIRLPVDGPGAGAPHLVPWEVLRLGRPEGALALSSRRHLVRQLVVGGVSRLPPRPRPMRVLAVTAGTLRDLPVLDFEAEIDGLQRALAGLPGIELMVERSVGLSRLAELLEATDCHVLHVMAHGGSGAATGGCLYLPGEQGETVAVDGERLATVLHDAAAPADGRSGLRLVSLNACRTAQVAGATPFTAVAAALVVHARVPAVIAMQYPIRDAAAVAFATEVYRHVALDHGVDEAVRRGRKRLRRDHGIGWAVPVLYSSLRDGRLFADPPPIRPRQVVGVVAFGLVLAALALWLTVGWLGPPADGVRRPAGGERAEPADETAVDGAEAREAEPAAGRADDAAAGDAASEPRGLLDSRLVDGRGEGRAARPATPQQGSAAESFTLLAGQPRDLPEIGGSIAVAFSPRAEDGALVTLTVGDRSETFLVFGAPEIFDVTVAGTRYKVEVVALDAADRWLRLRPPTPWQPP